MLNVDKVKRALDEGKHVVLVKKATREYPTSYSLVVDYEGDKVYRTPFEAEAPEDCAMFDVWVFTFSKNLATNSRVSINSIVEPEDLDCNDFDDDDFDDYRDRDKDNTRANKASDVPAQSANQELLNIIHELRLEIQELRARKQPAPQAPRVFEPVKPIKPWLKKVSL